MECHKITKCIWLKQDVQKTSITYPVVLIDISDPMHESSHHFQMLENFKKLLLISYFRLELQNGGYGIQEQQIGC